MANPDAAFGAVPIKHLDGSPYNGMVNEYYVPATDGTAMYINDIVKHGGTSDTEGVPQAIQATAGNTALLGSIVGFRADPSNLSLQYRSASTLRYYLVADAPDLVFKMQEDSTGGALAATEVGCNADIAVTAGSTVTGLSAMEIDSSDAIANTTAAANLRILRLLKDSNNAIGTNAIWEVMINEHFYKTTTGA